MHMGSSPIVRTNKKGSPHSGGSFCFSALCALRISQRQDHICLAIKKDRYVNSGLLVFMLFDKFFYVIEKLYIGKRNAFHISQFQEIARIQIQNLANTA